MKKTLILAAVPAMFALAGCGEAAIEEDTVTPETAVVDDDNDAPEPVVEEAHDDTEPHDESVPHDH